MVDMALNGSGIRDTARVLRVSPTTVINTLKKKESSLQPVNEGLLQRLDAEQVQVIVHKVEAAEVDEMWSFVGSKSQQRWLWHAIDHYTDHIGKYLSRLRKLDHVIAPKEGFETPLRASCLPITFGMSALGMTSQRRDGLLQRVLEPCHVPGLQGLDHPA
jgi:hypothetical protein